MIDRSTGAIKKGTIICLETGAYSDKMIVGHFAALRDIPYSEWNDWKERFTGQDYSKEVNAYEMVAEMTRAEMIEDAEGVIEQHADDMMQTDWEKGYARGRRQAEIGLPRDRAEPHESHTADFIAGWESGFNGN